MVYTPTKINPPLKTFQWSTKDNPKPRLRRSLTLTSTTVYWTSPPYDETGTIITGNFLMGVKKANGYTETIYIPAGAVAVDGLSATGVVRGVRLTGLDYTTGDTAYADTHEADEPVFCNISGIIQEMQRTNAVFPVFATTTERDSVITSPVNGKSCCYVTADGLYYFYGGGSWQSVDSGTVTPNASTTVAGKVEIATQAEANAGTNTGATGALLSVIPSNLAVLAQDNKYTYAGTTAGTSTAYTATVTPAPASYVAGQGFTVIIDEVNGDFPTINFNGLGARNIIESSGLRLSAGYLPANAIVDLKYNGTSFQVMNVTIQGAQVREYGRSSYGGATSQFDITKTGDTVRYTWDGNGTNPLIGTYSMRAGQTLVINGQNFNSANNLTAVLTNVGANFFEILNPNGVAENNVTIGTGNIGSPSVWTKQPGLKSAFVEVWGAGGSGGVAVRAAAGKFSGGGSGGAYNFGTFSASQLSATETLTVGLGGASVSVTNETNNSDGNAGGTTSFGTKLATNAGLGGNSSSAVGSGNGDAGADSISNFSAGNLTLVGGAASVFGVSNGGNAYYGGAGSGAGDSSLSCNGGNSQYGGGGGGGTGNAAVVGTGGTSVFGGNGGAAARAASGTATATNGVCPGGGGGGAVINGTTGTAVSGFGGYGYIRVTEYY